MELIFRFSNVNDEGGVAVAVVWSVGISPVLQLPIQSGLGKSGGKIMFVN